MKKEMNRYLSRREHQIMDILYERGEASVSDVSERVGDETSYDSVRITLGILAKKGYVSYHRDHRRYIYTPTVPRDAASRSAVSKLIKTFFQGSPSKAILTMLDVSAERLSKAELDRITEWLEKEKK